MVTITPGNTHDLSALDTLAIEPGATYVMDGGYIDFTRLYAFTQAGAYFVVRSRERLQHARVTSHPVDRTTGPRCDQTIRLTGPPTQHAYPAPLRRVRFRDIEHERTITYLTNLPALPALTIATLYNDNRVPLWAPIFWCSYRFSPETK